MAFKGRYAGPDKYKGIAPKGGKWKGKYIGKDSEKGRANTLKEIGQQIVGRNRMTGMLDKVGGTVPSASTSSSTSTPSDTNTSTDSNTVNASPTPSLTESSKATVARVLTDLKDKTSTDANMQYKGKYAGPDKYKGLAPKKGKHKGKWKGKYIGKDEYKGTNAPKGAPRVGAYYGGYTDAQGVKHAGNEPGKVYAL